MQYQVEDNSLEIKGILLPRCSLCGEVPLRGIMGGYLINGYFVCEGCEEAILNLEVGSLQYEGYVKQIKKILR